MCAATALQHPCRFARCRSLFPISIFPFTLPRDSSLALPGHGHCAIAPHRLHYYHCCRLPTADCRLPTALAAVALEVRTRTAVQGSRRLRKSLMVRVLRWQTCSPSTISLATRSMCKASATSRVRSSKHAMQVRAVCTPPVGGGTSALVVCRLLNWALLLGCVFALDRSSYRHNLC